MRHPNHNSKSDSQFKTYDTLCLKRMMAFPSLARTLGNVRRFISLRRCFCFCFRFVFVVVVVVVIVVVVVFSGDQVAHTSSTFQVSISPQWLSKLRGLWYSMMSCV